LASSQKRIATLSLPTFHLEPSRPPFFPRLPSLPPSRAAVASRRVASSVPAVSPGMHRALILVPPFGDPSCRPSLPPNRPAITTANSAHQRPGSPSFPHPPPTYGAGVTRDGLEFVPRFEIHRSETQRRSRDLAADIDSISSDPGAFYAPSLSLSFVSSPSRRSLASSSFLSLPPSLAPARGLLLPELFQTRRA